MEKMKVYVYINDTKTDDDDDIKVTVFGKKEDALAALKKDRDEVMDYWDDGSDWKVINTDDEDCFTAYEDGNYAGNHDHFYIQEKEIL